MSSQWLTIACFPISSDDSHFWSYRVISKVVPAPEAKPATPVSRPKTPPPVPSPVPAPVHVTPPPAPAPPPPQATVSPVLIPPPSPAVSAAGGSKAPVRSVVTETVSTYVVSHTLLFCPCADDIRLLDPQAPGWLIISN